MLARQAGYGWLRSQENKDSMSDDDLFFLQADVEFGQKQGAEAIKYVDWLIFTTNKELPDAQWQ